MTDRVRRLVRQIHELEDELRTTLHDQKTRVLFEIKGRSIQFTRDAQREHQRRQVGLFRWLAASDIRNGLSAPIIYGLFFPMAFYDLGLTIYQAVCFRLYRMPRVDRSRYIVVDRHHLRYLNSLERLNCIYCGYANGLLAYATEITARTEQYWCPIKHAHKLLGSHGRYSEFLDYGDADAYQDRLPDLRTGLRDGSEERES